MRTSASGPIHFDCAISSCLRPQLAVLRRARRAAADAMPALRAISCPRTSATPRSAARRWNHASTSDMTQTDFRPSLTGRGNGSTGQFIASYAHARLTPYREHIGTSGKATWGISVFMKASKKTRRMAGYGGTAENRNEKTRPVSRSGLCISFAHASAPERGARHCARAGRYCCYLRQHIRLPVSTFVHCGPSGFTRPGRDSVMTTAARRSTSPESRRGSFLAFGCGDLVRAERAHGVLCQAA